MKPIRPLCYKFCNTNVSDFLILVFFLAVNVSLDLFLSTSKVMSIHQTSYFLKSAGFSLMKQLVIIQLVRLLILSTFHKSYLLDKVPQY